MNNTSRKAIDLHEDEVRKIIMAQVGAVLDLDPGEIDSAKNFDEYGLDSVNGLIVVSLIEERVDVELAPELFMDNRTIDDVIRKLKEESLLVQE